MPASGACTVVVGCQWGDEGKGKIVDVLAEGVDIVARYQGGANAGHTVQIGDEQFILHQIPSGILHAGKRCLLGNGVVLDVLQFLDEYDGLAERGHDVRRSTATVDHGFGHAQVIEAVDGVLAGIADPRSLDGQAAGY